MENINIKRKLIQAELYMESKGITPLNLYPFGSWIYGTANKDSDFDLIVVVEELPKIGSMERNHDSNIDLHYYTPKEFQMKLDNHDIQMLECYFSPTFSNNQVDFTFTLDKQKLRKSISTIVNNSWVRGKKKLIVAGDYDLNLALKSVFHSIRILGLGLQIAREGEIINFSEYNWLLDDLKKMSKVADKDVLWQNIETKYKQKLFNIERSKFKALCPKPNNDSKIKQEKLKNLLKKNGITPTKSLVNSIVELFNT